MRWCFGGDSPLKLLPEKFIKIKLVGKSACEGMCFFGCQIEKCVVTW